MKASCKQQLEIIGRLRPLEPPDQLVSTSDLFAEADLDLTSLAFGSGETPVGIDRHLPPTPNPSTPNDMQVIVFPGAGAPDLLMESNCARDSDTSTRATKTIKRLHELGATRSLKSPAPNWHEELNGLQKNFPNFSQVITTIIGPHLALMDSGIKHKMPAVLLIGPLGIGKTQFALNLAALMCVPSLFLPMNSETNSSALAGSSTFWSNSNPGRLFELLAWGTKGESPVANPLIILDEADKVTADRYDPLAALYSLLEEETASKFEDQSLPDIVFDASNVRYILTANDASTIPEPILSRVIQFHIPMPTQLEQREITQSIFRGLIEKLVLEFDNRLCDEILADATQLGPRTCKVRLNTAIGISFASGHKRLEIDSWVKSDVGGTPRTTRMGFT